MKPQIVASRPPFHISTARSELDIERIHYWLSELSYWAQGRSLETVRRSIANSLCFGLYRETVQIGFARVVTDYATFGWLCDVIIDPDERGQGVGKWLIEQIYAHPEIADLRLNILATSDAHALYRSYGGFDALTDPDRWMVRRRPHR